ncbi:MAG: squalene/phytoene synthase family protein, partial [Acidimicrobiia bacterium]
AHQSEIAALVTRMATGMVWASRTFQDQDGVLADIAQLQRYCHIVIGEPTQFVLRLIARRPLNPTETHDALEVSELIQLANVTRDIERDLARGVAYHPALAPYLGSQPSTQEAIDTVQRARLSLTRAALSRVPAYRRLADAIHLRTVSPERGAAVAMLQFTAGHYERQAALLGLPKARRASPKGSVVAAALAAGVSRRWADRQLERSERRMLSLAAALESLPESAVTPRRRDT